MWASPRRLRRTRIVLGVLNVYTIGTGIIVYSTGDIRQMGFMVVAAVGYYLVARVGFRCARCGKSPMIWSVRHVKSSEVMNVVQRPDCPYCGFNGNYADG